MFKPNRIILLDLIKKYNYLINKGIILDIGSGGYERYSYLFNAERYITLDIVSNFKVDIVANIYFLPFKEHVIDGIICTQVLEHLEYPKSALLEMKKVLKPQGKILLSVPQTAQIHTDSDFFRFTDKGIQSLLKDTGFKLLKIERIGKFFSTLADVIMRYFIDKFGSKSIILPFLSILPRLLMKLDKLDKTKACSNLTIGWLAIASSS